jgi:hypothetical protein
MARMARTAKKVNEVKGANAAKEASEVNMASQGMTNAQSYPALSTRRLMQREYQQERWNYWATWDTRHTGRKRS